MEEQNHSNPVGCKPFNTKLCNSSCEDASNLILIGSFAYALNMWVEGSPCKTRMEDVGWICCTTGGFGSARAVFILSHSGSVSIVYRHDTMITGNFLADVLLHLDRLTIRKTIRNAIRRLWCLHHYRVSIFVK